MANFKQKGFSLIEMMVVVAIVGIVASISLPSYQNWIQNSRIKTATESILNGLQKAKAEAIRRNALVRFTLAADGSWLYGCVNATTCIASLESTPPEASGDINVITDNGNLIVTYNNLGIRNDPASEFNSLTVDNSAMTAGDSRELDIRVGAGGSVRMCNPNAVAPDLRAC